MRSWPHSREKCAALLLETIFVLLRRRAALLLIPSASPCHACGNVRIHQHGHFGLRIATDDAVQPRIASLPNFVRRPGRLRWNREAVAQHPAPCFISGESLLRSAAHAKQTSAPLRRGSQCRGLGIQQHGAHVSPIGVPPGSRVVTTSIPSGIHPRALSRLRAFAATVEPFKCDEFSAVGCRRVMITTLCSANGWNGRDGPVTIANLPP